MQITSSGTISINMVLLVLKRFLILSMTLHPHEPMLFVTDEKLAIKFALVMWAGPSLMRDVSLASSCTL